MGPFGGFRLAFKWWFWGVPWGLLFRFIGAVFGFIWPNFDTLGANSGVFLGVSSPFLSAIEAFALRFPRARFYQNRSLFRRGFWGGFGAIFRLFMLLGASAALPKGFSESPGCSPSSSWGFCPISVCVLGGVPRVLQFSRVFCGFSQVFFGFSQVSVRFSHVLGGFPGFLGFPPGFLGFPQVFCVFPRFLGFPPGFFLVF